MVVGAHHSAKFPSGPNCRPYQNPVFFIYNTLKIENEAIYLIIEAVGDFVPNDPADSGIVEIGGTILTEESALEDASREFCVVEIYKMF